MRNRILFKDVNKFFVFLLKLWPSYVIDLYVNAALILLADEVKKAFGCTRELRKLTVFAILEKDLV